MAPAMAAHSEISRAEFYLGQVAKPSVCRQPMQQCGGAEKARYYAEFSEDGLNKRRLSVGKKGAPSDKISKGSNAAKHEALPGQLGGTCGEEVATLEHLWNSPFLQRSLH